MHAALTEGPAERRGGIGPIRAGWRDGIANNMQSHFYLAVPAGAL
jgi:hypothetical protein